MTADDTPDKHGNHIRQEGVDRCGCGCKYWENDRCIDCGSKYTDDDEGPDAEDLAHWLNSGPARPNLDTGDRALDHDPAYLTLKNRITQDWERRNR